MYDLTEMLADFRRDSLARLADMPALVQALVRGDADAIGAIFRSLHTIKGSSSYFDLPRVTKLAHRLEDVLDKVRGSRLPATADLGALIQRCVDRLHALILIDPGQPGPPIDDLLVQVTDLLLVAETGLAIPGEARVVVAPGQVPCRELPLRLGEFLIARGWLPSDHVLDALLAQEREQVPALAVLRRRVGLETTVCLGIAADAEARRCHPFTIAIERGLSSTWTWQTLMHVVQESRPPLGEMLVRLGHATPAAVREWLQSFFIASRSDQDCGHCPAARSCSVTDGAEPEVAGA